MTCSFCPFVGVHVQAFREVVRKHCQTALSIGVAMRPKFHALFCECNLISHLLLYNSFSDAVEKLYEAFHKEIKEIVTSGSTSEHGYCSQIMKKARLRRLFNGETDNTEGWCQTGPKHTTVSLTQIKNECLTKFVRSVFPGVQVTRYSDIHLNGLEIHAPIQEGHDGDLIAFTVNEIVSFGFVKALVSEPTETTSNFFAIVDLRHIIQKSLDPFFIVLGPEGKGMLKINMQDVACACSYLPLPGTLNIFPLCHTLSPHVRTFGNITGTLVMCPFMGFPPLRGSLSLLYILHVPSAVPVAEIVIFQKYVKTKKSSKAKVRLFNVCVQFLYG